MLPQSQKLRLSDKVLFSSYQHGQKSIDQPIVPSLAEKLTYVWCVLPPTFNRYKSATLTQDFGSRGINLEPLWCNIKFSLSAGCRIRLETNSDRPVMPFKNGSRPISISASLKALDNTRIDLLTLTRGRAPVTRIGFVYRSVKPVSAYSPLHMTI